MGRFPHCGSLVEPFVGLRAETPCCLCFLWDEFDARIVRGTPLRFTNLCVPSVASWTLGCRLRKTSSDSSHCSRLFSSKRSEGAGFVVHIFQGASAEFIVDCRLSIVDNAMPLSFSVLCSSGSFNFAPHICPKLVHRPRALKSSIAAAIRNEFLLKNENTSANLHRCSILDRIKIQRLELVCPFVNGSGFIAHKNSSTEICIPGRSSFKTKSTGNSLRCVCDYGQRLSARSRVLHKILRPFCNSLGGT